MAREANPITVGPAPSDSKNYFLWHKQVLSKFERNTNSHAVDLTGSLLRFNVADGYAYYVVVQHSPLTVAHLSIDAYDNYRVEPAMIRGLKISDVRHQLADRAFFHSL